MASKHGRTNYNNSTHISSEFENLNMGLYPGQVDHETISDLPSDYYLLAQIYITKVYTIFSNFLSGI